MILESLTDIFTKGGTSITNFKVVSSKSFSRANCSFYFLPHSARIQLFFCLFNDANDIEKKNLKKRKRLKAGGR